MSCRQRDRHASATITNGTAGNAWDIIKVITTLKKLKSGDIRTFV